MLREEKIKFVRKQGAFIGIDVAKKKHFAQFIDKEGSSLAKGLSFSNNREGFRQLERRFSAFPNLDHNILFGFEPCGDYWKPLAYYLKEKGYPVVLVNPYHVKRTKEIIDNSQNKTDPKDAYLIADMCKQGKYFSPILPSGVYAELREANFLWRKLSKDMVRTKTYINGVLDKFFPERNGCFYELLGKSSFALLKIAPFPEDIVGLGRERLTRKLKKLSRGKLSLAKATLLYEKAKTSIGIKEGKDTARITLRMLLSEIETLKTKLKEVRELMKKLLDKTSYAEYLLSIPAVGVITASGFLGEIGNPDNYSFASQIEKVAGLNLVEISSGEKKGKRKISGRGRSGLRYIAYLIANIAIAKNREIRALYRYKVDIKNVEKMKALTAIAAKMLRLMFTLCKKKEYYNSEEIKRYWFEKDI